MKTLSYIIIVSCLISVGLSAQVTYNAGPGIPGNAQATYLPTAAYPAGQAAPFANVALPNAAILPATPFGVGGMGSDDRNGILYTSNGLQMAMDQNATYAGFGPLSAVPAGINPIALPGAVTFLTGLCYDDSATTLWGCSAGNFWRMNPLPPFNPVSAVLPIPGLISNATGLGYDSANNTLWACDDQGFIYHFTPGGAPIGVQPVNLIATPTPILGLAVNTTNGAGSFPAPGCSTQTLGYHVTVSDGIQIHDAQLPNPPIFVGTTAAAAIYGHTYSSDFQIKTCEDAAGIPYCASAQAGTRRVNYVGPGAPQALRCIGAPPLTSGFLLADLCPLPSCWFGLWLSPFTWSLGGIITDAAGEHTFPVSFVPLPAGVQFSFQYAIYDTTAPLGYCLSNLCTVTVGLP